MIEERDRDEWHAFQSEAHGFLLLGLVLIMALAALCGCQPVKPPVIAMRGGKMAEIKEHARTNALAHPAPEMPNVVMVEAVAITRPPPNTNHPPAIQMIGTAIKFMPVRTSATRYTGLTATNVDGPWTIFTNVILDGPPHPFFFFYLDDGQQRYFRTDAANPF